MRKVNQVYMVRRRYCVHICECRACIRRSNDDDDDEAVVAV